MSTVCDTGNRVVGHKFINGLRSSEFNGIQNGRILQWINYNKKEGRGNRSSKCRETN
jgi:hypothetical protein